jgi:mannitol-specific phosphotransferase system IIBC component
LAVNATIVETNRQTESGKHLTSMSSPFVSSLRTSLGATGSAAMVATPASSAVAAPVPGSVASKAAMADLFSSLDLALNESGAVVSGSAAKDLLASKTAQKQAEAELDAQHALKRQQQRAQRQQQRQEQPVTALSQALGLFDQELDERDSFLSRNKRRQKSSKKARGGTTASRGRRQRQEKYKRV